MDGGSGWHVQGDRVVVVVVAEHGWCVMWEMRVWKRVSAEKNKVSERWLCWTNKASEEVYMFAADDGMTWARRRLYSLP
jgi:hypothetical protein